MTPKNTPNIPVSSPNHPQKNLEIPIRCGSWARCGDDPYSIEVPRLTYRELQHLDAQLPQQDVTMIDASIPEEDLRRYCKVYRYFPNFAEIET